MEELKYCYKYPHHSVTTDCVIFGFDGVSINVLLIERGLEPFQGKWALPGGFLRPDETASECAKRELEEETGLKEAYLEQFHTFTDVDRDPRERVITIAYYALVKKRQVQGGDDARKAQWFKLEEIPHLAFDHDHILRVAMAKLKEKMYVQPVGFELLPEVFTMPELQNLYESILQVKFDRRNFAKKMLNHGLLFEAEKRPANAPSRHPSKYSFNSQKYKELKEKGFRLEF